MHTHLLQDVKNSVCGAIQLVVRLDVLIDHLSLVGQIAGLCDDFGDGLASHATTLGSEVDAFAGALRHIASSVAYKGGTTNNSSWSTINTFKKN